jgi:hypothetical protein
VEEQTGEGCQKLCKNTSSNQFEEKQCTVVVDSTSACSLLSGERQNPIAICPPWVSMRSDMDRAAGRDAKCDQVVGCEWLRD